MNQTVTPVRHADAESKIEAVLAALQDSWNRHDMPAFAAQFTQDADFVNVLGMRQRGCPAIEAQHIGFTRLCSATANFAPWGNRYAF